MGSTTERWRSYVAGAKTESAGTRAQDQTFTSEQQRRFGEVYLGSEEQLADEGNYDPSIIPYSQRYAYDQETMSALGGNTWAHDDIMQRAIDWETSDFGAAREAGEAGKGVQGYAEFTMGKANDLMGQAQQAAEDGDFDLADSLKTEADALVRGSSPAKTGPESSAFTGAFYLKDNADYIAKAQLSGPMANTAGQIVREGSEILDRNSETSKAFRSSLTKNANQRLAASARGAQRNTRMMAMAGAGNRNPMAAASMAASGQRELAMNFAQIESQAAAQYENYRTQFSMQSVDFGMGYLDKQAGVRDEFVKMNNDILMHQAEMMMESAKLSQSFSEQADARAAASQSRTDAFIGMGVGAVASAAGGMMPTPKK